MATGTPVLGKRAAHRARRDAILDIARSLFSQHGYAATTVDQIARAASLSVGSIYNLGGSKDQLFAAIVEEIGRELVDFVRSEIRPLADSEQALAKLIRYRLQHQRRHDLFLVLFAGDHGSRACPSPARLADSLPGLHAAYMDELGGFLASHSGDPLPPLHLALCFEGIMAAFTGHAGGSADGDLLTRQTCHLTAVFRHLIRPAALASSSPEAAVTHQHVYLSRYDYDRLRELLHVARGFGHREEHPYLSQLTSTLNTGRIVDPRTVPPDVITMNSRFRLADESRGSVQTRTLVFPADADHHEAVSVLSPLGAALLGRRPGDRLAVPDGDTSRPFVIRELLYQPESAGDYHL